MGAQLTRPEYWQTAYHLLKAPPFLALLALLVPRQPALHEGLLQLLGRTLGALGNTNHDMAKGFLNIAVQVGGCPETVAGQWGAWERVALFGTLAECLPLCGQQSSKI